jgi:hypothetical protein
VLDIDLKHRVDYGLTADRFILMLLIPEFDSVFQVGVPCENTSVSPLYLWERARVRVLLTTVG